MALTDQIGARLLRYFAVDADIFLCPSGTDALLATAILLAADRPDEAPTALLPSAAETGTGVPFAATGRWFDGPDSGAPLTGCVGRSIEIPLRSSDGSPRDEDEVNDAFARAAATVRGHVVVYLTHSTKTGLIAPVSPPQDANVIVDACQARIAPETVANYLRHGWPVVVTGSKFFGGPAFSGAIMFPPGRLPAAARQRWPSVLPRIASIGTALRWTAAMTVIEAFEPLAESSGAVLAARGAAIERRLESNPALVPVPGLQPRGPGWADLPSIFTFGVRDPEDRGRLYSPAELRPLYQRLAHKGVLLGQPVNLGPFGGLRIAVGARDLLDADGTDELDRVFAALEQAAAPS